MQHRLVLVRHAEAAHAAVDADRPLTEHGSRAAAAIGAWLRRTGLVPDRVLVSPARRAAQTWEQAGAAAPSPVVDLRIYGNSVAALLAAVRETPDDVATLALVGHNPSIQGLAALLDDGNGSPPARRGLEAGFRAGGVAVLDLDVPWADLAPGAASLTAYEVPGA
ncbi:SixA phosphatase family protein [Geodermatophilus sp. SYSU D00708]